MINKFVDVEGGKKVENIRVVDLLVDRHVQQESRECDDLPIPTLFSLSLLSSPVLNMTLNCINYALMLYDYDRYVERSLSQDTLV